MALETPEKLVMESLALASPQGTVWKVLNPKFRYWLLDIRCVGYKPQPAARLQPIRAAGYDGLKHLPRTKEANAPSSLNPKSCLGMLADNMSLLGGSVAAGA